MTLAALPALNAALNATSAAFLIAGFGFIRRRLIVAHRACMLAAFATSTLFLVSYLTYHARVGSVSYRGTGWHRPLYFSILIPHTILAAAIVPLAILTLRHAFRGDDARHARLARVTLPIWLFVSVSGVAVYLMLYGH